jgi:hypothetical protein
LHFKRFVIPFAPFCPPHRGVDLEGAVSFFAAKIEGGCTKSWYMFKLFSRKMQKKREMWGYFKFGEYKSEGKRADSTGRVSRFNREDEIASTG